MVELSADPLVRRRSTGASSARSLLLTVLGEFALPRREPVWTSTVLAALAAVGVEPSASRQALARTSAETLLVSQRHGRRTAWTLTAEGQALLEAGTTRIYSFMRQPHNWDGAWMILSIPIPESQRKLRHRLRTQLTWLGLGSPTSGLWVSPSTEKLGEVQRVIDDLGLTAQSLAWVGPAAGRDDQGRLVTAAWDLADVEEQYLAFVDEFENRRAESTSEAFAAQVELVQQWRRFPFIDPDLPRELLDHDWPGHRAAALFHDRHELWHRQAQQEWDSLQSSAAGRQ